MTKEEIAEYHHQWYLSHRKEACEQSKIWRQNNKERKAELDRKYQKDNKIKNKEYRKQYFQDNKNRLMKISREHYQINKNKIDEWQNDYSQSHKEEKAEYDKDYRQNHRIKINERHRNKYKTNIQFKILCNIRSRIRMVLKGISKSQSTIKLLGCSVKHLKKHLESLFQNNMTWENYGKYGWHIDHIKPCSLFDLTDSEEQKRCFNFTNLQPLWATDNYNKRANYR